MPAKPSSRTLPPSFDESLPAITRWEVFKMEKVDETLRLAYAILEIQDPI